MIDRHWYRGSYDYFFSVNLQNVCLKETAFVTFFGISSRFSQKRPFTAGLMQGGFDQPELK